MPNQSEATFSAWNTPLLQGRCSPYLCYSRKVTSRQKHPALLPGERFHGTRVQKRSNLLTLLCYLPSAQRKCCLFRTRFKTLFTESEPTSGLMSRATVTSPGSGAATGPAPSGTAPAAPTRGCCKQRTGTHRPLGRGWGDSGEGGGHLISHPKFPCLIAPNFNQEAALLPPGSLLPAQRLQMHIQPAGWGEARLHGWVPASGQVSQTTWVQLPFIVRSFSGLTVPASLVGGVSEISMQILWRGLEQKREGF